ncbi:hypothetical protein [Paenibacillus sp. L3-i20]|uniref:hypothetical protein n=1 Tax=Paenibacillus sp. L3-i20 TaxID=2905833 RepID=UPI001EDFAD1C|nr:hypothetical protein [Paenibacillus sp. L3-i20]GKU77603.1 hypothetical protein L3i20_v220000 [Paenibacillus sp. L3-i20]
MTKQEALEVTANESLSGYNLDDHAVQANEVGTQYRDSKWIVYSTDERVLYRVIGEYDEEDKTISHVIECLRINKRFEERRNRKRQ